MVDGIYYRTIHIYRSKATDRNLLLRELQWKRCSSFHKLLSNASITIKVNFILLVRLVTLLYLGFGSHCWLRRGCPLRLSPHSLFSRHVCGTIQ